MVFFFFLSRFRRKKRFLFIYCWNAAHRIPIFAIKIWLNNYFHYFCYYYYHPSQETTQSFVLRKIKTKISKNKLTIKTIFPFLVFSLMICLFLTKRKQKWLLLLKSYVKLYHSIFHRCLFEFIETKGFYWKDIIPFLFLSLFPILRGSTFIVAYDLHLEKINLIYANSHFEY